MKGIQDIIRFVVESHAGQVRKASGLPYIVHPMAVLSKLGEWFITDSNCWYAALCHDILEDCPNISWEILVETIGQSAADVVRELTFLPQGNSLAGLQKDAYLKSFDKKSIEALSIKVADRMCNTMDFVVSDPQYARKYWKKAHELFETMLQRRAEFDTKFGLGTFTRMRYSQTLINERVQ